MAKDNPPRTGTAASADNVPKHRQCPLCFNNPVNRGVGQAYSTKGRTRYYKCNHCGFTWTHEIPAGDVEHQQGDDVSAR